jgi:hypothetical protein
MAEHAERISMSSPVIMALPNIPAQALGFPL